MLGCDHDIYNSCDVLTYSQLANFGRFAEKPFPTSSRPQTTEHRIGSHCTKSHINQHQRSRIRTPPGRAATATSLPRPWKTPDLAISRTYVRYFFARNKFLAGSPLRRSVRFRFFWSAVSPRWCQLEPFWRARMQRVLLSRQKTEGGQASWAFSRDFVKKQTTHLWASWCHVEPAVPMWCLPRGTPLTTTWKPQ